jgi:hypothetical protein
MNGMDAVIQIRNGAVKGFSIYADKTRGCAERLPLRASPDAFHSTLKIRKSEVVPVNQGFLCSERSPDSHNGEIIDHAQRFAEPFVSVHLDNLSGDETI